MAGANQENVPKAGLRATLRFIWRNEKEPWMTREVFGRVVLLGALKLKVEDVYCLQTNSQEKSWDVTFFTQEMCLKVMEDSMRLAGVKPLQNFEVVTLDKPNFRILTIHVYNPHITDEAVVWYLGRYVEVLAGPRRVKDVVGFWTGKRQYQVLLKPDPAGVDGWCHPPAFFNIGADRGYLFYSRQPLFCRRCRCQGHSDQNCGTRRCRVCQEEGHEARDCPVRKACYICGAQGHLARDCKKRDKTYAATAERQGEEPGPPKPTGPVVLEEPLAGASGDGVRKLVEDVMEELQMGKDAGEAVSSALEGPPSKEREGKSLGVELTLEAGHSGAEGRSLSDELAEVGAAKAKRKKKRRELTQSKFPRGGEACTGEGGVVSKGGMGAVMEGVGEGTKGGLVVDEIGGAQGGLQQVLEEKGNDVTGVKTGLGGVEVTLTSGEVGLPKEQEGVGEGTQEAMLSPRGTDAYEGPLRPSLVPNVLPFSWAELCDGEQMDTDDLYGD